MRDFSAVKRVVVKVGTNLLSSKWGVDETRIQDICVQISRLRERGIQVILVSSGAIGMGAKRLGLTGPVKQISMRQACAAVGQPLLMDSYQREFGMCNIRCAQVLITRNEMNKRKSYVNLRESVFTLLSLGVVPIFNENDVVSTAEIGTAFGDNDRMSALVASKIDADLLIILSDIPGFYTADPKKDESAQLLRDIPVLNDKILAYAGGAGSTYATGGMKTKLLAARIATLAGCGTLIASGEEPDILERLVSGCEVGSYIHPARKISQRERWIINTPSSGSITVDEGALSALESHRSLLPCGVVSVDGQFEAGDVVEIKDMSGCVFAKAVPYYGSTLVLETAGRLTEELDEVLGAHHQNVLFRPEDLVFTRRESEQL